MASPRGATVCNPQKGDNQTLGSYQIGEVLEGWGGSEIHRLIHIHLYPPTPPDLVMFFLARDLPSN